jgi:hypothetical protein
VLWVSSQGSSQMPCPAFYHFCTSLHRFWSFLRVNTLEYWMPP